MSLWLHENLCLRMEVIILNTSTKKYSKSNNEKLLLVYTVYNMASLVGQFLKYDDSTEVSGLTHISSFEDSGDVEGDKNKKR